MGDRPRLELFAGLAALYKSRDHADLTLISSDGATTHAVHRAIVCPRSAPLDAQVKAATWKDGVEGHILLPEDDDAVVGLLVEYLYLLDYDPVVPDAPTPPLSDSNQSSRSVRTDAGTYGHVYGSSAVSAFGGPPVHFPPPFRSRTDSSLTMHAMPTAASDLGGFGSHSPPPPQQPRRRKGARGMVTNAPEPSPLATTEPHLVLHARMYAAASRYEIAGLKALALDKFKIQLTLHWESPELARAIHVVYVSTPSEDKDMREAIADTLIWHSRLLDKHEIEVAVLEINGLAYELLKRSRRLVPDHVD